jgi:hypothetical protein
MNESSDSTSSRSVNRAERLKQRIKDDGEQRVDSGKRAAADQMEEIADAIDLASSQLDQSQPTLASYASKVAEGVGSVATRLRDDSIEDLYRDARRVAAQHPGLFLLGGAVVGLAVARFMKAEGVAPVSDDAAQARPEAMGGDGAGQTEPYQRRYEGVAASPIGE